MANTTMANTTRQLSADDAAFLLDVLHHLEAPISVSGGFGCCEILLGLSDQETGQCPPDRLIQEYNSKCHSPTCLQD
jgi:hypothetical protein